MANIHTPAVLLLCEQTGHLFAVTHFINKSAVKMCWHELHDKLVISENSSMVQKWSARTAWWTFPTFLSVLLVEGQQQCGWSSTDSSSLLKWLNHWYTRVLPMASSLEASLSTVKGSTAVFLNRKQNFTHTHTLRSGISIKKTKNCQTHL